MSTKTSERVVVDICILPTLTATTLQQIHVQLDQCVLGDNLGYQIACHAGIADRHKASLCS